MSAQTDAIIALLSETAQKDLLEALQAKAGNTAEPAEPPRRLSMPCPICGDLLQVLSVTTVSGRDDLRMYWCRGVNPLCRCSEGICMGDSKPGELAVTRMTEAEIAKIKEPVVLRHPVVDEYEDEEDSEEETEEPCGGCCCVGCCFVSGSAPKEERRTEAAPKEDAPKTEVSAKDVEAAIAKLVADALKRA